MWDLYYQSFSTLSCFLLFYGDPVSFLELFAFSTNENPNFWLPLKQGDIFGFRLTRRCRSSGHSIVPTSPSIWLSLATLYPDIIINIREGGKLKTPGKPLENPSIHFTPWHPYTPISSSTLDRGGKKLKTSWKEEGKNPFWLFLASTPWSSSTLGPNVSSFPHRHK